MSSATNRRVQRALISVSDKSGIGEFATKLHQAGIQILSTGGTAALLRAADVPVTDVSEHTHSPEIMDGRVKTLHPKIHGGILGRAGVDDDVMQQHGIDAIDLVVVNLYPFAQTIAQPECTLALAIENIDIGGPAMIRAAAKNFQRVSVVVDPADYSAVLAELANNDQTIGQPLRFHLACKAFSHTAEYDGRIANYLGQQNENPCPDSIHFTYNKKQVLRYGENPHQTACFYSEPQPEQGTIAAARLTQGKELSFNNIADTDAALQCVKQFKRPACVIVKHANPCGVAVAESLEQAYQFAFRTDPTSAFGGIIAFNHALDAKTAKTILDQQFVEVIIAPGIDSDAIHILNTKPNTRVLDCGTIAITPAGHDMRKVSGGLLLQDQDHATVQASDLNIVTQRKPSEHEIRDLLFAWKVAKYVKSNAIVYAHNERSIGIGAGQMSRVYSAKIAGIKAQEEGLRVEGSVMASDAFFPFRDGLDAAHDAGISAVIQPGGSRNDKEVIAAADEHGMAMVFTGIRHFRH